VKPSLYTPFCKLKKRNMFLFEMVELVELVFRATAHRKLSSGRGGGDHVSFTLSGGIKWHIKLIDEYWFAVWWLGLKDLTVAKTTNSSFLNFHKWHERDDIEIILSQTKWVDVVSLPSHLNQIELCPPQSLLVREMIDHLIDQYL